MFFGNFAQNGFPKLAVIYLLSKLTRLPTALFAKSFSRLSGQAITLFFYFAPNLIWLIWFGTRFAYLLIGVRIHAS